MTDAVDNEFNLDNLEKSTEYIKSKVPFIPKLMIICGSGLGGLADTLEDPVVVNYKDIPNFPVGTVEGHAGKLVFGTLSNVKIVCMQGRFHYYEGFSLQKITMPIRIMKMIGVKGLIVTNSAGGVNITYKAGDIMVIKDHLNFFTFGGQNPLKGKNDSNFGERFFPMNKAYDKELIAIARRVAQDVGLGSHYHEGVYGILTGPNYETVAEVRALKILGVDAVGASTVPEVLVAKHCGLTVFGFSIITNECVGTYEDPEEPSHGDILDVVEGRSDQLKKFVVGVVERSREMWQ